MEINNQDDGKADGIDEWNNFPEELKVKDISNQSQQLLIVNEPPINPDLAFKKFEEINSLVTLQAKHREWLKEYSGLFFSIGEHGFDKVKWQADKDSYVYADARFSEIIYGIDEKYYSEPNKIQRLPCRLMIEFDLDEDKNETCEQVQERLGRVKAYLIEQGWGYIQSTHKSTKGSDYLWVEFNRKITDLEAKKFLIFIADKFGEQGKIDMNFASSERRFPVLFARHWKYSNIRELPIDFHKGKTIDYDALLLEKEKPRGQVQLINKDGFEYEIYGRKDNIYASLSDQDLRREIRRRYIDLINGKNPDHSRASEIIVDYIKKRLKIYTTKEDNGSEMWYYDDGIYKKNGTSEVKRIMRELVDIHFNPHRLGLVVAKIEADTFIESRTFFNNNLVNEIPVLNGILNVRTYELSPYTSEKIFFAKIPVTYNKEAKCEKINAFLEEVLKTKDDKNIVFEILGSGLYKENLWEKATILLGDGRNGKGALIGIIKKFIGAENCASLPLTEMQSESFSVHELQGKLYNLAGDLSATALKDTGMFKGLTSRDLICAKRKFLSDLYFHNYSKMIFACNELPMVYDLSKGFWARWIMLEFPYTFLEQSEIDIAQDKRTLKLINKNLVEQITTEQELSGLLNEALDGLSRLFTLKSFSKTQGSETVKFNWMNKANSFLAFAINNLEEAGQDEYITKAELRKNYHRYLKMNNVKKVVSEVAIKKFLEESYGVSVGSVAKLGSTSYESTWEGIKWKFPSDLFPDKF